ncbi:hypothetical protein JNUCC0626_20030 [Lentzea sp. JNUCC 0626]|uniref:hypothetical protein n=1 Tax=Lentzea sp. JNUCC 0626 TaxID=3367513 RepID=UPI0037480D8D
MSTPALDELLADPAELAALTGLPADDSRLVAALVAASRRFAGAVRCPIRRVEQDEVVLDGNGTTSLLLPAAPVTAVHLVELDGVALDAASVQWSADGLVERTTPWPRRRRCLRIVYSHGYDPVPGMVSDAVTQAAHIALNSEPGMSTLAVGGMSVSWSTTFGGAQAGATEAWSQAVERYRLNRGDRA